MQTETHGIPAGTIEDRAVGALVGLAIGDALGTSVEFMSRGNFAPVTGMRGGGVFQLKPGEWTDDTSMALALGEALLQDRLHELDRSRHLFDSFLFNRVKSN